MLVVVTTQWVTLILVAAKSPCHCEQDHISGLAYLSGLRLGASHLGVEGLVERWVVPKILVAVGKQLSLFHTLRDNVSDLLLPW